MRILALEPYYGGSHKAFLEGWVSRSTHIWTLLTLIPRNWKWRMRHSAITFSNMVRERSSNGEKWDAIVCSDMLNLPEFLGLAPLSIRALPSLVYFHENQLTYPVIKQKGYDYHFVFSNMTTALAANEVWFNSQYHLDSFLDALDPFLRRMPDYQPLEMVNIIRRKSCVRYPGIEPMPLRQNYRKGPVRILWAARWEHDKSPELFFQAIAHLEDTSIDFVISVIGGHVGRDTMPCFAIAKQRFSHRIRHWGYQKSREAYCAVLAESDIIVSTAEHEFFGISILEAVSAGVIPLVPNQLAYPEVLNPICGKLRDIIFYNGTIDDLTTQLIKLTQLIVNNKLPERVIAMRFDAAKRYAWETTVNIWDKELKTHLGKAD